MKRYDISNRPNEEVSTSNRGAISRSSCEFSPVRDEFSHSEDDSFSALIRAAAGGDVPFFAATESSEAGVGVAPAVDADAISARQSADGWVAEAAVRVERRVMFEIARRSIERAQRRVRLGIVVCGAGFAMAMAGALVAMVAWSPVMMADFGHVSWFGEMREWISDALGGAMDALSASAFVERWGVAMLTALGVIGMTGLFFVMNRAFSDDYAAD